jgi:hypothetical protein
MALHHGLLGMRRVALALWIAWAVIAWNVIVDQTIVLAGRDFVQAAIAANNGPFPDMDAWMRPAAVRGVWLATAASAAILLTYFFLVRLCASRPTR